MYSDREHMPPTALDSPAAVAAGPDSPIKTADRARCDNLPPDCVLLARFAACNTDPIALAEELNIRLDLLLDWLAAPDTTKRLNALLSARAVNRHQKHLELSDAALDELVELQELAKASDADDAHIERRRIATNILRFTSRASSPLRLFGAMGAPRATDNGRASGVVGASSGLSLSRFPAQFRTRSRIIRTVPILHEPPAILAAPDQPDPALSPAEVTIKLLQRLQDSDNPVPGDGLRTLHNHFTPEWCHKVGAPTADDFACTELRGYAPLLAHHSAVLLPTEFPPFPPEVLAADVNPRHASQHADFIDLDGRCWRLALEFTRGSAAHPWLINELRINAPPGPAP